MMVHSRKYVAQVMALTNFFHLDFRSPLIFFMMDNCILVSMPNTPITFSILRVTDYFRLLRCQLTVYVCVSSDIHFRIFTILLSALCACAYVRACVCVSIHIT